MARFQHAPVTRALGRLTLVGALVSAPLALGAGVASATDWDAVAQCESGGKWTTQTGNGYGGGLQFTNSTWHAFGGKGQPEHASKGEQVAVAEKVKSAQGMKAWPTCSKKTGNSRN